MVNRLDAPRGDGPRFLLTADAGSHAPDAPGSQLLHPTNPAQLPIGVVPAAPVVPQRVGPEQHGPNIVTVNGKGAPHQEVLRRSGN